MAEKVVSVALQAKVQGFVSGMQKAKASVDDLTKAAAPNKAAAFEKLADKAALAGVGVATAVGVAVKRFADFDQAMSAVQANSGATGASLDALRKQAIKLGADSQFSATEAAQGINELAKAGVDSADILQGGLKGSLDLAAAGQIGVADAAETAATALTQFKLSGSQVPHVADLLANAANKAQGGVGDMAQALKQAGLVAASTGLSIEETTAGLTAFAAAGLIGSDAGTSFKTMLQRLSAPTDQAKEAMDKLGISAYDNQGNFVGLANVAGQLQKGMSDLTPEVRNAALATIFGSDAVRAANVLYENGATGIRKWTDEVSESGAAAKQAATLTDNLKGDIERLGGALDSVFISSGSGANSSLRGLVQGLTGFVDAVGKVPGPVLLMGGALTSVALLLPKGVLSWRAYKAQIDAVTTSSARLATTMKAVEGSLAVLGVAVVGSELIKMSAAASVADVAVDKLADSLDGLSKGGRLSGGLADLFRDENGIFGDEKYVSAAEAIKRFGDAADDALGDSLYSKFVRLQDLGGTTEAFQKQVESLDGALAQMVQDGNADAAKSALDRLLSGMDPKVADKAREKFTLYAAALDTVGTAADGTVAPQSQLSKATDTLQQSAEDAQKALDNLRKAILGLGSTTAQQRAATNDYEAAIDAATKGLTDQRDALAKNRLESQGITDATKAQKAAAEAWATAQMKKTDLLNVDTEAGRQNRANLDDIAETTKAKVAADFEQIQSTKGTTEATKVATQTMQDGRKAFIDAARAAGNTKTEANKLADQLGLIPRDVAIKVSETGAAETKDAIDAAAKDRTVLITIQRRYADLKARQADEAGGYDPIRKATGGAIYGPGTATSDSIAALLSNGEHVWTAAEVSKLGGQGAMYALRAAVRSGNVPRFAEGGAVASRFAPQQIVMSGRSDGMGRQFVSGSLDMGDGLTGFVRAIVDEAMTQRPRNGGLVSQSA